MMSHTAANDLFLDAFELTTAYASRECPDDVWPVLTQAEETVLRHRPTSFLEAAAIAEALLLQSGERADDLDRAALEAVRDFLLGQAGVASIEDLHGDRARRPESEVLEAVRTALAV